MVVITRTKPLFASNWSLSQMKQMWRSFLFCNENHYCPSQGLDWWLSDRKSGTALAKLCGKLSHKVKKRKQRLLHTIWSGVCGIKRSLASFSCIDSECGRFIGLYVLGVKSWTVAADIVWIDTILDSDVERRTWAPTKTWQKFRTCFTLATCTAHTAVTHFHP